MIPRSETSEGLCDSNSPYSDSLFAAVYGELKQIAFSRLRKLPPGQTLHATVLVHEAYLKLTKYRSDFNDASWPSQSAFFGAASEAMRRILIDHYRNKMCQKRGGQHARRDYDLANLPEPKLDVDLLALEEVLCQFEVIYPEKAQVVKLRYFVGMTMPECADALGISMSTAERHWRFARAWLAEKLEHCA
jgi:RNA polymerase sigma factor (TIGR02999 family)